ncbi:retrovirus-related pol polyprotein from transposon TNT 1-94 [Tanacetum coccineum]
MKPNQKDQVVLEDSLENLENKSIVAKHKLSSKITQSPYGSSYTSEGSENSGSFKNSERSDEEDSKDEAFYEEGVLETPQVRRSTRESRALVWYSSSANYLLLIENDEPESYSKGMRLDIVDIKKLKRQLSQEFKMKDLGSAKQILCMSIIRDKTKDTLRLSREKYIRKVLEKFNMNDAEARCQPLVFHIKLNKKQAPKTKASLQRMAKVLYALAVGSVMYAMVCTRPDIAHAVGLSSRFMSNPEREHWEMVKWLLCYLKGSLEATLCFSRKEGGITVSWMSRIQKCVAMSTAKADYMAISAIHLAKNPVFYGRTKHIKIRYHYIREVTSEGTLAFKKIIRAKNPTDMITKVREVIPSLMMFVRIPCIESLLAMRLVSATCSVCLTVQEGSLPTREKLLEDGLGPYVPQPRTTTISQPPPSPRHHQDSHLTTTFISSMPSVTTVTSSPPRPPYHRDPHTTSPATPP